MAVECLVSRDVIWQPGLVAKGSIMATADRQETSGHGDRVVADKL